MSRGVPFFLGAMVLLLVLAGCGRGLWQSGERAPWRHEAEVNCLKSGAVKLGGSVVQIEAIEGPGVCGADFPLKVSELGEETPVPMSYSNALRPPASITGEDMPRWPVREVRYASVQTVPAAQLDVHPQPNATLRWVPGPPGIIEPETTAPAGRPMSLAPPSVVLLPDDIPDDAVLPPDRVPAMRPAYIPPQDQSRYRPPSPATRPLGPLRGPATPVAAMPATLTPPATLSCPIVSALDRWVSEGVQPAAEHWFGSQVVSIKQIGSYACRDMVGAGGDYVSEHAFGDALDIAGFTLADGRTITVKDGWHGTPEEQGFLHDVQLYACETFSTVLAPGYNIYHYNHIHVDLMRRTSGRHPCRPDAIPGEVAATKARAVYAARHRAPRYTGSIETVAAEQDKLPLAVPGADGFVEEDRAGAAALH